MTALTWLAIAAVFAGVVLFLQFLLSDDLDDAWVVRLLAPVFLLLVMAALTPAMLVSEWRTKRRKRREAEEEARNAALVKMINDSEALRAAVGSCVAYVDLGCDGIWLHRALDRHHAARRRQFYQLYQPPRQVGRTEERLRRSRPVYTAMDLASGDDYCAYLGPEGAWYARSQEDLLREIRRAFGLPRPFVTNLHLFASKELYPMTSKILKPARTVDGRAVQIYDESLTGPYSVIGRIAGNPRSTLWTADGRDAEFGPLTKDDLRTTDNANRWNTWPAYGVSSSLLTMTVAEKPIPASLRNHRCVYAWLERIAPTGALLHFSDQRQPWPTYAGSLVEIYANRCGLPFAWAPGGVSETIVIERAPAVPRYVGPPIGPVPPAELYEKAEEIAAWFEMMGVKTWELGGVRARFTSKDADVAEIKRLEGVVQAHANERDNARERASSLEHQLTETQRQRDDYACEESKQRVRAGHAEQELKGLRQALKSLLP